MKQNIALLVAAPLLIWGCSTEEEKSTPQPNTTVQVERQSQPQPQPAPQQPPQTYEQPQTTEQPQTSSASTADTEEPLEEIAFEDSETIDQSDYTEADPNGNPYDPDQSVAYDPNYYLGGNSDYDPESGSYFNSVQDQFTNAYQDYNTYGATYDRPYLGDRYRNQRQFLNYQRSFRNVRPDHHSNWNQTRHRQVQRGFERSNRWVNYDVYNLVQRTVRRLGQENFRSRRGLEDKIRGAIGRRDHARAVQLHDELVDESNQGRRIQRDNRGTRGRRGHN